MSSMIFLRNIIYHILANMKAFFVFPDLFFQKMLHNFPCQSSKKFQFRTNSQVTMFHNLFRLPKLSVWGSKFLHSAIIHNSNVVSESDFQSINPATGDSVGNVSNCSENEVLAAIQSAKDCFEAHPDTASRATPSC